MFEYKRVVGVVVFDCGGVECFGVVGDFFFVVCVECDGLVVVVYYLRDDEWFLIVVEKVVIGGDGYVEKYLGVMGFVVV